MELVEKRCGFLVGLVFVLLASPVASGDEAGPSGRWGGAIQLSGDALEITVVISRGDGAKQWSGTIDVPAQGNLGLGLIDLKVDGASVTFGIQGVSGKPTFKGTLSADAKSIAGEFTQYGRSFPFKLTRGGDPVSAATKAFAGFGDFVKAVMADWKVPGLAVAVVVGDKVVFAEGFGVRDVKQALPVTRDTLFAIGSTTKAFTATVLGMLVEEGKIEWDKPVRNYLPAFRLKDAFATERVTPRDLVTHRTGLPRHDLAWYGDAWKTRKEVVEKLQFLELSADLREKWQYQNMAYVVAGFLAGEVAGTTWEDLVRKRILEPLGMKTTNFSVDDSKAATDFALPYAEKDGAVTEIPFRNISLVGPAGSMNSSAAEMVEWLRVNLGRVTSGGSARVVSKAVLAELHRPQMVVEDTGTDSEITGRCYGLGWMVDSYRGHVRIHHGGGIDGFTAKVAFLPRDEIGVVVLANMNGSYLPEIVERTAVDRLLGVSPRDWNKRLRAKRDAVKRSAAKSKGREDLDRKKGTKPAHPIDEYTGDYSHPAYGVISVTADDSGALKALFHGVPIRLDHWHYETFRATPDDPMLAEHKMPLLFRTDVKGEVDALSVPLEPLAEPIVFSKLPPARLKDPAFLRTLVGTFVAVDDPNISVTVALRPDNILVVSQKGTGELGELEPYLGTEFKVRRLRGYSIRFVVGPKGEVNEALLIQPGMALQAKRKD